MSSANATAEGGTLTLPRQPRKTELKPVTLPAQEPSGRDQAVMTVAAGSPESRYWQAVTRYLEDYRESQEDRPAYRSPAQAAEAAARFQADAEAAAGQALRAQQDTRTAARRADTARTTLDATPAWQWRVRARLRAEADREDQRRTEALRHLDEYSASMEFSLRRSRHARQIAAALRRSDRAHLAAADAAGRALGWRPGSPLPSRSTLYVAGRDGVESLPAIVRR